MEGEGRDECWMLTRFGLVQRRDSEREDAGPELELLCAVLLRERDRPVSLRALLHASPLVVEAFASIRL